MYAIKMNNDKSLSSTIRATIYQYEKNADTLIFLVPMSYDGIDLAGCTMLLRYILPDGTGKSEELEMDPETYKDYYQYRLKFDTTLTSTTGRIELWLSAINMYDNVVLKTGSAFIEVSPSKDITEFLSPEDKDQLSQLSARVTLVERRKADNIFYNSDEQYLQLMSGSNPIGDKVNMSDMTVDSGDTWGDMTDTDDSSGDDSWESM